MWVSVYGILADTLYDTFTIFLTKGSFYIIARRIGNMETSIENDTEVTLKRLCEFLEEDY